MQQHKRPLAAQPRHAAADGLAAVKSATSRSGAGRAVQSGAQLPLPLLPNNDATRLVSNWAHAAGIRAHELEVLHSMHVLFGHGNSNMPTF
jgi:hypothetical protein